MLSGTVPFKANNMDDLHKLILKGNYTPIKDISVEAADLISGLLEIDPKKRYDVDQVLNHPWLINADNNGNFKSMCIGHLLSQLIHERRMHPPV